MSNSFEKIEDYLLETFHKREGRFGCKPRMSPTPSIGRAKDMHECLLSEGLVYLENNSKEAIASIHPKRGITFNAEEKGGTWRITIEKDERVHLSMIDPKITSKGVAVLGELDLSEIQLVDYDEIIYFRTYDKKICIKMECGRFYPKSIYTRIISVE